MLKSDIAGDDDRAALVAKPVINLGRRLRSLILKMAQSVNQLDQGGQRQIQNFE